MPRTKVKKLSSLFRSAVKATTTSATTAATTTAKRDFVKLKVSSSSTPARSAISTNLRRSTKSKKDGPISNMIHQSLHHDSPSLSSPAVITSSAGVSADSHEDDSSEDDSAKHISHEISTILCGYGGMFWELNDDSSESEVADDDTDSEDDPDSSWFSNLFNGSMSLRRKELSRERKNKWIFKNTQKNRFDKLVNMCLTKLGSGSTFQVLYKLGRETGLKEYTAFINGCIQTARRSKDEKAQVEQVLEIYRLFQLMKERGFPIEEETFGPFLLYLIDMHLTDHFFLFVEIVKDEDISLHPRLGYYEMLLWIEMGDDERIQELCDHIATGESESGSLLHENYLLALCERDREKELRPLLEIIDITKFSSIKNVSYIFQSLGRLSLESYAEFFIQTLKDCDHGAQSISNLVFCYATSLKNLAVEDVIMKFKEMHGTLDIELLPGSYENLIRFCCIAHNVHMALDIVDEMCEAGLVLSTETLNYICRACEDTSEYILVRRIHSMLCHHNLKANNETFRSIINLNVRMKDFDNAYTVLKGLERFNLMPTASMYNAIIAGYYREKNLAGVLRVLEEMKHAKVKPDAQTFSYLISNSVCEEDVVKYFEELNHAGVPVTKHIYMALINAYAACGQFEKAKQVVLEKGVPVKNLTEIRSVLVASLASHGQISDALEIYIEMKQSGRCLEPKAILTLIESLVFEEELSILLQLLDDLNDPHNWVDGCCRVILCCVRNKELRSAVDLLRKLADHFKDDGLAREVIFDEVFSQIADMEAPDLQIGIGLLKAIKEELKLRPSRKCLDFLLGACVSVKDLQRAQLVWNEYPEAGLPYNILSYLRMYQAYLASGSYKAATRFLSKIPRDDPHVQSVIHACGATYGKAKDKTKKKKKKT